MALLRRAVLALFGIAFAATGLFDTSPAFAQGGLTVTPTRVVFEERDRSAAVTLVNRGTAAEVYRIFLRNQRMTEEGQFKEIAAGEAAQPGELFSDGLIVHSPRQVRLEPGVAQSIRLLVRKPEGLAEGEYRSHLVFQIVPSEATATSVEEPTGEGQIAIQLVPVYGVSIPVIVRHGALEVSGAIENVKIVKDGSGRLQAEFMISRVGGRSIYGDLTASVAGRDIVLGQMNGVAVYTPNGKRKLTLPLNPPAGALPSGERIRIAYKETGVRGALDLSGEALAP